MEKKLSYWKWVLQCVQLDTKIATTVLLLLIVIFLVAAQNSNEAWVGYLVAGIFSIWWLRMVIGEFIIDRIKYLKQ